MLEYALDLSSNQLDKLADWLVNLSLLFFGALVLPLFVNVGEITALDILLGILLSSVTLVTALLILENHGHYTD